MRCTQQSTILDVKDTKTFTVSESKPYGEKNSATRPTRGVPKRTLKQYVCRYFMTEILYQSGFRKKTNLVNILLPFIHQAMKANK